MGLGTLLHRFIFPKTRILSGGTSSLDPITKTPSRATAAGNQASDKAWTGLNPDQASHKHRAIGQASLKHRARPEQGYSGRNGMDRHMVLI
eukprot:876089-Pelagomonas_calceolata.AAC.4